MSDLDDVEWNIFGCIYRNFCLFPLACNNNDRLKFVSSLRAVFFLYFCETYEFYLKNESLSKHSSP